MKIQISEAKIDGTTKFDSSIAISYYCTKIKFVLKFDRSLKSIGTEFQA